MKQAKVQNLVLPFDLAIKFKELGFKDDCVALVYDDGYVDFGSVDYCRIMVRHDTGVQCVKTPLWDQAIDWLNDQHKIRLNIVHRDSNGQVTFELWYWGEPNTIGKWERVFNPQSWGTREEARYEGMKVAIGLAAERTSK